MLHRLAIITVVYQNYSILKDFLESLKKQKNKNFHLFLVDLSDEKKPIDGNDLPMRILTSKNLGYAYGVNIGLKKALAEGFDFFCVVNDDIYFNNDFVDKVIKSITYHPSSIIGGKIYYAPGYEFHKDRYSKNDLGKVLWYAGGTVDWNHALTPHRGVDEVDNGQYDKLEKTDFVNGALMGFDKTVIDKVGFWEESYFLYFEDSDFCQRAKRKNISLWYDPKIVIWHKNAQSTGGSGSKIHQKYQEKSRLRFGLKYAPWRTKLHLLKNYLLRRT